MNINFEEFSSEKDMLEYVKRQVPSDYDEVYTARHNYVDDEVMLFYDRFDLEEWMEDYITQNAEDPDNELLSWEFAKYEVKRGKLIKREVSIYAEYSLELNASLTDYENWEEIK